MKKVLLISALVMATTGGAFAGTAVKAPTDCGPVAETFADTNYQGDTRVGFKLKWTLGQAHKDRCSAYDSHINSLTYIERKEESARASQQETKALKEKVQLCQSFKEDTAPGSIKDFCGDLIGQSLKKSENPLNKINF